MFGSLPSASCALALLEASVHPSVKHSETLQAKYMTRPHWAMMFNVDGLTWSLARLHVQKSDEKGNSEPTERWPDAVSKA